MRAFLLALALSVLLPSLSFANTAAEENGGAKVTMPNIPGDLRLVGVYFLCSDYAAGDGNCTPFDLSKVGFYKTVVIHQFDDGFGFTCTGNACVQQTGGSDDCGATPAFEITTAPFKDAVGGADASPASARGIATDFEIDDSSETARVITIDATQTPLDRYLFTTMSGTDTSCDDIDIAIYFYDYDQG